MAFGEGTYEGGGAYTRVWQDELRDKQPLIERTNGVLSALGVASHHGLWDAYRDLRGFEKRATPVTYCTRTNPRCFDHTFGSRHFDVLKCDYYHKWCEQGLSDHLHMWARLRLRADQAGWNQWAGDCP